MTAAGCSGEGGEGEPGAIGASEGPLAYLGIGASEGPLAYLTWERIVAMP